MSGLAPWRIAGTYLESCNCDPICPCRRIGGRAGGRSTYGVCLGALSWLIEDGRAADIDLRGVGVVLVSWYDDDEPGSPWRFHLYIDERAEQAQHDALASIFLGNEGGTVLEHFPWAWKESQALGVSAARIDIDHTPGRGRFRVGDAATLRVRGPVADPEPVTCVIPGHDRSGREVHAELLRVDDPPLEFELEEVCGYESTFEYVNEPEPR